ncbi:MAG: DUF2892 domain-containing protein [Trichormus sp. ATA11-4-KO1]|nr:DUF2892 domain-containing protein [Trichormus sp. ATA11-4-KO1]
MSVLKALTTRNVGKIDRVIRSFPTLIVAYLYFMGMISGWLSIILGILALMLLLTSILGSCSIYYFLGYSTCPIKKSRRNIEQN